MIQPFRIAIIGPEASGKTELAGVLARHFGGVATEEYARRYFVERALPADHILSLEEMRAVMEGQQGVEQGEGLRFIDASCIHGPLYAGMRRDAWGELYFDLAAVDAKIMDYARQGEYDAFILCWPHEALEWIDDGMRAMPVFSDRVAFAEACAAFIASHYADAPCIVVDAATWEGRAAQAVKALAGLFNRHSGKVE